MKRLFPLFLFLISFLADAQHKTLSKEWIQLFNGKDLKDWHPKITHHPYGENFGNTFRVDNGLLKVNYDQYQNFDNQFGHLFYKDKFSYYLLLVEYRFVGEQVQGGAEWALRNSGAMIHSQDPKTMELNQDFPTCLEVQFLGGNGKDERHTANLCTPGTNVMMKGKLVTEHCINSNSKTFHGDQWVRIEVLVLGDSVVKHIVDGDTVMVYEKPQIGDSNSGTPNAPKNDGQPVKEGFIALQSESHPIEFRKVELFNLEPYSKDPEKLKAIIHQLQGFSQSSEDAKKKP